MLSFIKGELVEIYEDNIIIENNGIGFNVRVPSFVIESMPAIGQKVFVYVYMYVREEVISLFGFLSRRDLDMFKLLLNVSGIGPKGALAILSTIKPDDLRFAILSEDSKQISSAPGIGIKTAKRVIIELKDKMNLEEMINVPEKEIKTSKPDNDIMMIRNDAVEALVALGYGNTEAMKAVRAVENIEDKNSETVLKEALKKLY